MPNQTQTDCIPPIAGDGVGLSFSWEANSRCEVSIRGKGSGIDPNRQEERRISIHGGSGEPPLPVLGSGS